MVLEILYTADMSYFINFFGHICGVHFLCDE